MNEENSRIRSAAEKVGLHHGRMISWSKSGYRRAYPDNVVVFNASIADNGGTPLWSGDLDLTVDEPKLLALAAELDVTIHVLYESDALFIGRTEPFRLDVTRAVARFTPDRRTSVSRHWRVPKLRRNAAGQLEVARDES